MVAQILPGTNTPHRWHVDDVPYERIRRETIADNDLYFYLVTTASFIEITSDIYTRNLIEYYAGDEVIADWLNTTWEPEELQHGTALKRYVQTVWPEFDWESAYRDFQEDYSRFCKVELLGPTRALEMAARCVVEMGTCSYYTMLHRGSPEPVLADITRNIRTDEAYHYKHFYEFFLRYQSHHNTGRWPIFKTLVGRIAEIDSEDGMIAIKHVWRHRHPGKTYRDDHYRAISKAARGLAQAHYPYRMAANMTMKPLRLPHRLQTPAEHAVAAGARLYTRITGTEPGQLASAADSAV
jgi:hypothetical protein